MIGVHAHPTQSRAIEEFFEVFKTPWEFCRPGARYEVVITTAGDPPASASKLLVVSGLTGRLGDDRGCVAATGTVLFDGHRIPIYCGLATFIDGTSLLKAGADGHAGVELAATQGRVARLGYDIFGEAAFLLSSGQPAEHAGIPALDLHVAILRQLIVDSGVALVEIAAAPAGCAFIACLTHDIDFVGIRRHFMDHSMWGFLYRATIGALRRFVTGRLAFGQLVACLRAAASLPFVYLGWARDFWMPFDWYLEVERDLPTTYFLIPFKHRAGERVTAPAATRRASGYDVTDIPEWMTTLRQHGCELGVHGIDAWHSAERGREELARLSGTTGQTGIRMHWLLQDADTPARLEAAGYSYDATAGYNDAVGYKAGTTQVYRPLGCATLLELPLHIQDGALFYAGRQNLSDAEAQSQCDAIIDHATTAGGVVTLLWHDRSHGPERFWGDFYVELVTRLRAMPVWFASGAQAVAWFRQRRAVKFVGASVANSESLVLRAFGAPIQPALRVRVHHSPSLIREVPWNGAADLDLDALRAMPTPTAAIAF